VAPNSKPAYLLKGFRYLHGSRVRLDTCAIPNGYFTRTPAADGLPDNFVVFTVVLP
jgi:hypothetical protein